MKHSPASPNRSDIPASRALAFRGAARSLSQALQRSVSPRVVMLLIRSSSKGAIPLEVNLQHALGLSGCAVGWGETCKVSHIRDEARSPCDCQLALLRNVPNSHNSVPISWYFKVRSLEWPAT